MVEEIRDRAEEIIDAANDDIAETYCNFFNDEYRRQFEAKMRETLTNDEYKRLFGAIGFWYLRNKTDLYMSK